MLSKKRARGQFVNFRCGMATSFDILNQNIMGVRCSVNRGAGGMSPLENLRMLGLEWQESKLF